MIDRPRQSGHVGITKQPVVNLGGDHFWPRNGIESDHDTIPCNGPLHDVTRRDQVSADITPAGKDRISEVVRDLADRVAKDRSTVNVKSETDRIRDIISEETRAASEIKKERYRKEDEEAERREREEEEADGISRQGTS